jgi:hypothetical protein
MKKSNEVETVTAPTVKFYAVHQVEGQFFKIETLKVQGDKIVDRTIDEDSDYLAVKLAEMKHKLFGRFYFPDKDKE